MGCVNNRMVSWRAITFYTTKFKGALHDLLNFMKIKKKKTFKTVYIIAVFINVFPPPGILLCI